MELVDSVLYFVLYYIAIISTICIHEFGHYITAKLFKRKTNGIRISKILYIIPIPTAVILDCDSIDNVKMFNIKHFIVTFNGILFGLMPLGIYLYYNNTIIDFALMGFLYLWMCSKDIKNMILMITGKEEQLYETETMTIHIPQSEEECLSLHPDCSACGYHMLKECKGDKSIFPNKFKLTDAERISIYLEKNKAEFFKH